MRLVASVMAAVGVKAAVQVMPPSLLLTALSVPLATARSALLKPVTASLKVMLTSEVSPIDKAASANTMVAVGLAVSMSKTLESVVPVPALPDAFRMPVLSSEIMLVSAVTPTVGVKVAVQVRPPSLELTALRVPLLIVKSALLKLLTASEKVKVTVLVSPSCRALSATLTDDAGRSVATV